MNADSPFHAGERAVQRRAAVPDRIEDIGRRMLRGAMPAQHREFFAQLPFVVLGAADAAGRLQATLLAGRAGGFIGSPDETTLAIDALPPAGDPLAGALQPGSHAGLLGIELPTRRRNRTNGRIAARSERGFTLRVTQSFGNCPKYIQRREPDTTAASTDPARPEARAATRLDATSTALVAGADTFFIASRIAGEAASAGCDVSHRGGRPGFVQISDEGRTLTWPDYSGNSLFNTLGNLAANPEAALVFADFASGDLLHLTGRAEIVWDGPQVASFAGAERLVRMQLETVLLRPRGWPLRWRLIEISPAIPGAVT